MKGGGESERRALEARPRIARGGGAGGPTRPLAALIVVAATAIPLVGCGQAAQNKEAQRLENVSVLSSTAPLQSRMIKQGEIEAAPDTAAVRTFLLLWSRLQFESWPGALELFEPGLRRAIGDATLTQALEADVLVWQATKPGIVNEHVGPNAATIEFVARDERDRLTPSSITFRRAGAHWLVAYMSLLDSALQRSVQTRVQAAIEPLATKPAAEAVRQGYAALALQSTYLQRELAAESRRKRVKAGP